MSVGRTFRLRDEEDEDVQVVEPSTKSPKKRSGTRGGKTKQSAKRKQTARTREPFGEPSVEQMEEHQTEEHPVSGSEEELEQPLNADTSAMKSPRKGKRTAKRKRMAQPKERQTADPSGNQQAAEKNAGEQQTVEPSTRMSPRTRSGIQNTVPTAQCNGKKKHPANEQPEAQTAEEPTPLPKFIDDDARERFE